MTENKKLPTRQRLVMVEAGASLGMILIAVGIFLPLLNMMDVKMLYVFRWIFGAGALLFWASRAVPLNNEFNDMRIRRMHHMEFWVGACFGVATFFWFYNCHKFANQPYTGALMILRDTIMFALAGAVLQLIAAWMIYFRQKKLIKERDESPKK